MEKLKISIIDFLPQQGKHEVGKDKNGEVLHIGDTILRDSEEWIIVYRYGESLIKQPRYTAMLSVNFFQTEKINIITAAQDWAIICMEDDPMHDKFKKHLEEDDIFSLL